MAAGDALFSQRGLHGRNGGGENVRLLENLRSVWPIQRAEHGAVVELHSFIQFNYRELVPTWLGAPVFILRSHTGEGDTINITLNISPFFPPFSYVLWTNGLQTVTMQKARQQKVVVIISIPTHDCSKQACSPPPSFQSAQYAPVLWLFSEQPRGWCGRSHRQSGWSRQSCAPDACLCSQSLQPVDWGSGTIKIS